jgi:hypothetical protein
MGASTLRYGDDFSYIKTVQTKNWFSQGILGSSDITLGEWSRPTRRGRNSSSCSSRLQQADSSVVSSPAAVAHLPEPAGGTKLVVPSIAAVLFSSGWKRGKQVREAGEANNRPRTRTYDEITMAARVLSLRIGSWTEHRTHVSIC